MGDLSPHFSRKEVACHDKHGKPCPYCGGLSDMDAELIEALEDIREFSGRPVHITSGYRCKKHNEEVGSSPTSSHLTGKAADFAVTSDKDRFKFLEAIFTYGPHRVGIGSDFIHIDVDKRKAQEVCWGYDD